MESRTSEHRIGRALALAGLIAILVATLRPESANGTAGRAAYLWCLVCGPDGVRDLALNLLLFIPYGLGLRLAGMSWRRTVCLAALTSFAVEALQFWVVPGRYAGASDLVTNTISGMIGASLAPWVGRWLVAGREAELQE